MPLFPQPFWPLLAQLNWKLKWAFLIPCCPSSVHPSARLSVNFSDFHLLHKNHWNKFNQLGTNHPFGRRRFAWVCSNERSNPLLRKKQLLNILLEWIIITNAPVCLLLGNVSQVSDVVHIFLVSLVVSSNLVKKFLLVNYLLTCRTLGLG